MILHSSTPSSWPASSSSSSSPIMPGLSLLGNQAPWMIVARRHSQVRVRNTHPWELTREKEPAKRKKGNRTHSLAATSSHSTMPRHRLTSIMIYILTRTVPHGPTNSQAGGFACENRCSEWLPRGEPFLGTCGHSHPPLAGLGADFVRGQR
ncbi:hypothetical protein I7I53_10333 [Histoplasma capsulatum var. duboisii H88]|uniref:Uncharacterized protein n=1 Tax=Ajellomyces capsulatus (strain H88) TaxID=544711 RepID=A0A8A1L6W4_AJEC8|nr:hypothetical protein I7I53_10333 [Histoplasma capsulatum var. duboisii H88]